MFHNDLIGRMALPDERGNDLINAVEFLFGKIDTRPGVPKHFAVFAVCKESIIMVFMWNGTTDMGLITAVADIGSPVKPVTAFLHKILTVLVAGGAGRTFRITENDFSADILLLAVKTVDAEIFSIQEEALARIETG